MMEKSFFKRMLQRRIVNFYLSCQMMKRKELTDGGTWKLVEFIGCSDPYPCIGGSTMTDTIHMDRQCCKGHLCTDGNNTGT